MSALQTFARLTGLPLDLEIDEHSRGKIMRASILPAIVLSAAITKFMLQIAIEGVAFSAGDAPRDEWERLHRVVNEAGHLQYVALAWLFAAGVFQWSRQEGSWMFFVALTLAAVSLISGVALTLIYLLFDDLRRIYFDLRAPSFESLTVTTGLLAIGYFFLAYRGLASQPPPRRRRRIRRPQPPSTLALLED
jgi:hypothetical protein